MQTVGAKHAALGCKGRGDFSLDINAKPSCNKKCCDGQEQSTQSKEDFESYSPLEKSFWSSPMFVEMPVDAARCVLNVRINFCLLQIAERGSEV